MPSKKYTDIRFATDGVDLRDRASSIHIWRISRPLHVLTRVGSRRSFNGKGRFHAMLRRAFRGNRDARDVRQVFTTACLSSTFFPIKRRALDCKIVKIVVMCGMT